MMVSAQIRRHMSVAPESTIAIAIAINAIGTFISTSRRKSSGHQIRYQQI
jgi:hypothetical protein